MATPHDATAIAEIYNAHVDRRDCTMDLDHWAGEAVAERIRDSHVREAWLTAAEGDAVQGWAVVRPYSDRRGYRTTCEISLYIRPERTSCGIGQALFDQLVGRACQLDYHLAISRIFAANDGSIRFHRRNGFTIAGTLHEAGYIDGKWIDVVIMERVLG